MGPNFVQKVPTLLKRHRIEIVEKVRNFGQVKLTIFCFEKIEKILVFSPEFGFTKILYFN